MAKYTKTIKAVADKLGIKPKSLEMLINFESRFNPKIKNPYSSARGLIQFTDSTAQRLGFNNSLDLVSKYPTVSGQLANPVYRYLRQFKPFPNEQSLFMAVFYPKYRNVSPYKQFPKSVQAVNPNIKTPSDYIKKVYTINRLRYVSPFMILIGVGTLLYFMTK